MVEGDQELCGRPADERSSAVNRGSVKRWGKSQTPSVCEGSAARHRSLELRIPPPRSGGDRRLPGLRDVIQAMFSGTEKRRDRGLDEAADLGRFFGLLCRRTEPPEDRVGGLKTGVLCHFAEIVAASTSRADSENTSLNLYTPLDQAKGAPRQGAWRTDREGLPVFLEKRY